MEHPISLIYPQPPGVMSIDVDTRCIGGSFVPANVRHLPFGSVNRISNDASSYTFHNLVFYSEV